MPAWRVAFAPSSLPDRFEDFSPTGLPWSSVPLSYRNLDSATPPAEVQTAITHFASEKALNIALGTFSRRSHPLSHGWRRCARARNQVNRADFGCAHTGDRPRAPRGGSRRASQGTIRGGPPTPAPEGAPRSPDRSSGRLRTGRRPCGRTSKVGTGPDVAEAIPLPPKKNRAGWKTPSRPGAKRARLRGGLSRRR